MIELAKTIKTFDVSRAGTTVAVVFSFDNGNGCAKGYVSAAFEMDLDAETQMSDLSNEEFVAITDSISDCIGVGHNFAKHNVGWGEGGDLRTHPYDGWVQRPFAKVTVSKVVTGY